MARLMIFGQKILIKILKDRKFLKAIIKMHQNLTTLLVTLEKGADLMTLVPS